MKTILIILSLPFIAFVVFLSYFFLWENDNGYEETPMV